MWADFWGLPVFHARAKSVINCSGVVHRHFPFHQNAYDRLSQPLRGFIARRPLERRVGRLGDTGHLANDAVR